MSLPIAIYMFIYIIPHCLNPFVTTIKTVFYTFAFHRPGLPERHNEYDLRMAITSHKHNHDSHITVFRQRISHPKRQGDPTKH
jgi:hypothetical protein